MAEPKHRIEPDHESTGWPPGVPYIIGNEAAERFSFYGMRAILYVHLAALYQLTGVVVERSKDLGTSDAHLFITGVYALPMIGAIFADRLFGKYPMIIGLSLVYCLGHAVLAVAENSLGGMHLGLGLIALGAGGIKPCVSAHVGDQFGKRNWFRVRTVFQIFYFSINFGSAFATILIPRVREAFGTGVAFGIPGVLMFVATFAFWLGRHKFVHVPPKPGGKLGLLDAISGTFLFLTFGHLFFTSSESIWIILVCSATSLVVGLVIFAIRQRIEPDDGFLAVSLHSVYALVRRVKPASASAEAAGAEGEAGDRPRWATSGFWAPAVERFGATVVEGPVAVVKVVTVFFMVSFFWALFDQHSSSWIRQASLMDLHVGGTKLLPSEIPALNPFMVMLLIPIMNLVYKGVERVGIRATPLRRMSVGMFVAALSFAVVAILQGRINAGGEGTVSILWQILPYLILTTSEVMVSITGLEFAYTQAPKRMKSTLMGFWLLTVALGNVLVALLARFGGLALADFFWVFAGLMTVAAALFALRAAFYTYQDYSQ